MSAAFLDSDEVAALTGRKMKSKQIEALRKMGVAFFVNACGKPVVTRAAVEGRKETAERKPAWDLPK
jgi:hypothetical protein